MTAPNAHGVGFLPGGKSLKYGSSFTVQILKNRDEVPGMIDEWLRRTKRSLHELAMSNYAFLIDKKIDEPGHLVSFVKCRNRDLILEWFSTNLGTPSTDGRWEMSEIVQSYNPMITIRSDDDLLFFRMVWE